MGIDLTGRDADLQHRHRDSTIGFRVEDWDWHDASVLRLGRPGGAQAAAQPAVRPAQRAELQQAAQAESRPKRRRRPLSRRWRLARAGVLLVVAVAFLVAVWSYVGALTSQGSASVGTRTVEWISNDVPGGRAGVLFAERLWYGWTAPPAGGTPAGGIPKVAAPAAAVAVAAPDAAASAPASGAAPSSSAAVALSITEPLAHLSAPPAITPIAADPLAGEGQWQPAGRLVAGMPAIRVTYLRPDPVHTSLLTGVMWLDTKMLRAQLVPGTQLPGSVSSWPGLHSSIPAGQRASLMATFNSGFLLRDSGGGWYDEGVTAVPLVQGVASFVIFKDGTATVAEWGRDASMTADVVAVRQNLQLIVDGGQVNPAVATDNKRLWGKTLGNTTLVWRSGVGVTQDGALVYAAGDKLSVKSLADVLLRAGAVRAMELDINSKWTSANYYELAPGDPQIVTPTKLLSGMSRSATRYLVPDERDFTAMFARY
jgi:hypothetical protein